MKKALLVAAILLVAPFSFADEIVYQDPVATSSVLYKFGTFGTGAASFEYIYPTNEPVWITQLALWMQASTTGTFRYGLECQMQGGGTQCPGWAPVSLFAPTMSGLVGSTTIPTTGGGALTNLFFNLSASSTGYYNSSTQKLILWMTRGDTNYVIYGNNNSDQNCSAGGSGICTFLGTGAPYLYIWGQTDEPSQLASSSRIISQITPANGATAANVSVQFVFSWYNTGLEGYDVAQTEINDLTQGFQYTPIQSNAALSGTGQTTQIYTLVANHLHTWRACLLNSVTAQKTCSGFYSLNVVGPSASSSIPVLPEVNETNATSTAQGGIFAFLNVPQLLQSKYPFSWFFDIADLYQQLQASSTEDVTAVELSYSSLDISSTTKNALPSSWVVFSTSTITQFIPTPVLDAWRLLMTAVIWMSVVAYLYRAISKLFSGNTEHV